MHEYLVFDDTEGEVIVTADEYAVEEGSGDLVFFEDDEEVGRHSAGHWHSVHCQGCAPEPEEDEDEDEDETAGDLVDRLYETFEDDPDILNVLDVLASMLDGSDDE